MDAVALILTIVGAINWGSIGIFGFDIVGSLFGGQLSVFSRIIFTIVGLAGCYYVDNFSVAAISRYLRHSFDKIKIIFSLPSGSGKMK